MLCSDEKYFTFDKGTGTITDYDALDGGVDVRIPYSIGGEDVLHIGERAFYDKGLKNVCLPKDLKTIGSYAFANNLMVSIWLEAHTEIDVTAFKDTPIINLFGLSDKGIDKGLYAKIFGKSIYFNRGAFWMD